MGVQFPVQLQGLSIQIDRICTPSVEPTSLNDDVTSDDIQRLQARPLQVTIIIERRASGTQGHASDIDEAHAVDHQTVGVDDNYVSLIAIPLVASDLNGAAQLAGRAAGDFDEDHHGALML